jgi:hypothetical protein
MTVERFVSLFDRYIEFFQRSVKLFDHFNLFGQQSPRFIAQ